MTFRAVGVDDTRPRNGLQNVTCALPRLISRRANILRKEKKRYWKRSPQDNRAGLLAQPMLHRFAAAPHRRTFRVCVCVCVCVFFFVFWGFLFSVLSEKSNGLINSRKNKPGGSAISVSTKIKWPFFVKTRKRPSHLR